MIRVTSEGYASKAYARAIAGSQEVIELPNSGAWLIRSPIAGTQYSDARAAYPLLRCHDWTQISRDLAALDVVSTTAITDPFALVTPEDLRHAFPDHLRRWKDHHVAVLDSAAPTAHVSSHHRRYARRALGIVSVESTVEPSAWADDWVRLYGDLREHHRVEGPADFSEQSLRAQLGLPSVVAHRAVLDGVTVSMLLWIRDGRNAYYHLGASNAQGYAAHASFALFWRGLNELSEMGVAEIDLGAGAGNDPGASSGLSRFKSGWSNDRRETWLGGRIGNVDVYNELSRAVSEHKHETQEFFPAYRAPYRSLATSQESAVFTEVAKKSTMSNESRTAAHARNSRLESLLSGLNEVIGPLEDPLVQSGNRPKHPVVLVVGGPRSGSTVTMQYLAASGAFAYPTNILSRFSSAPSLGARIQLLLTDPSFDHLGELADVGSPIRFDSDLGKSSGALQPHEFWYFWRRFFPISEPRQLSNDELAEVDMVGFLAELAAVERILDKPLAMKAMLLQMNAAFLAKEMHNVIFVDVERHPFFQCQSLLLARRRFFGNTDDWYSAKPPEYEWLQNEDSYTQIAGQVYFGRQHLNAQLAGVSPERVVHMSYAELCADANLLLGGLEFALEEAGCRPTLRRPDDGVMRSSDTVRISDDEAAALIEAYRSLSGQDISP